MLATGCQNLGRLNRKLSEVLYLWKLKVLSAFNFDGMEFTDVVRKVESFIILPLFSYRLCNKTLQYNDILQNANLSYHHNRIFD